MKNILHLFKRDVQNVSRSVIGLVVVMGLIIVPCLYAWFNIARKLGSLRQYRQP